MWVQLGAPFSFSSSSVLRPGQSDSNRCRSLWCSSPARKQTSMVSMKCKEDINHYLFPITSLLFFCKDTLANTLTTWTRKRKRSPLMTTVRITNVQQLRPARPGSAEAPEPAVVSQDGGISPRLFRKQSAKLKPPLTVVYNLRGCTSSPCKRLKPGATGPTGGLYSY